MRTSVTVNRVRGVQPFSRLVASLLFMLTSLALAAAPVTAQDPVGAYTLIAAGSQGLPLMVSRAVPWEGTTLHGGRLELLGDGALRGEIIVSHADSATVWDVMLVQGFLGADFTGESGELRFKKMPA